MINSKLLNEIVIVNEKDLTPTQIVNNFIKGQSCFGSIVSDEQKNNIHTLAQLLYFPNSKDISMPIIADLPMGEGKSCLLVEFLKFQYMNDADFGALVVKKTLKECEDFCKDLNEIDIGAALTVKGFNYTDCQRYKNPDNIWGDKSLSSLMPEYVPYDYRLCAGCPNNECPTRQSKTHCKNCRIVAISHERLFLSNDFEGFIEELIYFQRDGEKIKRNLLIIDEKIDMVDIIGISDKDIEQLKRIACKDDQYNSAFFDEAIEFQNSLEYADKGVTKQNKLFRNGQGFELDASLLKNLYMDKTIEKKHYENLVKLRKVLSSKNITTNIPYKEKDRRCISAYEYFNLNEYTKNFDKCVILDATSNFDDDYIKSDAVLCSDIKKTKRKINVFEPILNINMSKASIKQSYESNIKKIAQECNKIMGDGLKKTIIVFYKEIDGIFNCKEDLATKIRSLRETERCKL